MSEYISSEELQRHNADVFANKAAEKKQKAATTETDRFKKLLDNAIEKHSSTLAVRNLAKENERTADYQLDLSADIVEVLTKIKSELG